MAYVSGPTRSHQPMPEGQPCDDHPDRPARCSVFIESDSFGNEYADLCEECLQKRHAGCYGERVRRHYTEANKGPLTVRAFERLLNPAAFYAREEAARRRRELAIAPEKCDWCKNPCTERFSVRDTDEGYSGPVYRVCGICYGRQQVALERELGDWDWNYME